MESVAPIKKQKLNGVIAIYDDTALFHSVEDNGDLSAGKYLQANTLSELFKFLNGNYDFSTYKFSGMVPKNVLKYSTDTGDITFYTEPQRRTMIFHENTGLKTREYNIPFIIWKYYNGSLYVFSCKEIPDNEQTKLYQAPFLNTNSSGGVCMGNVRFKNRYTDFKVFMENIQDLFFNSVFNATHVEKLTKNDLFKTYEKASSKDFSWDNSLVELKNKTLKDIL